MARVALRVTLVLLLVVLVLPAFPGRPAHAGKPLSAMPPHPRLWDQIASGEVTLPRFLTDPAWARSVGLESPQGPPRQLHGTLNVLAVAVQFSDNNHTVTASYFDTLMFAAPVAGRGSVRDYYQEVSYGAVDIVTVNLPSSLGWQTAPQPYAYYVGGANCTDAPYPNNCQKLAEDVVDALDSVVDFSNYDNDGDGYMEPIVLIHAGPGAEFTGSDDHVWSHSWSLRYPRSYDGVTIGAYVIQPEYFANVSAGTSDMTIGVFAHEMGHGFWDLPDVYDRGDDGTKSWGVGKWSLMAGGSWNGPNSGGWGADGSSPAWPDAWCRAQMGFVTPTNIASNQAGYAIPQAYNSLPPANTVLKLRSAALAAQEYFLLENRQRATGSYDEYLPGAGLLIWHADDAMNVYVLQNDYECSLEPQCNCSNTQHYLLALQQADGQHHLEMSAPAGNGGDAGDPFPGTANRRSWTSATAPGSSSWYTCNNTCIGVTNISDSGASMTADLQVTCSAPPPATHWIYLPLVLRNFYGGGAPAPTVTPQPTVPGPTVTPQPTTQPPTGIANGDFEQGPVVWTQYSQQGWDLILNSGWPGSVTPRGGSWAAWLGGDDDEINYIQQHVVIPAGTPYLGYYHWIASEDWCGYDTAYVRINGVTVDQYDLCEDSSTGGWVLHTVDLSGYTDQSLPLQIRVETDGSYNSNLFIDDVHVRTGPAELPGPAGSLSAGAALPRAGR